MKKLLLFGMLISFSFLQAQKISTRSGYVKFFSDASLEDIEAENNQVSSVIDLSNSNFAFVVPIKGFVFEKALMQEHFNENYMESGKYPNATFKGKLEGYDKIELDKDGTYKLVMKGTITIHGVEKPLNQMVDISVNAGQLTLNTVFNLKVSDFGIEIPSSKADNIANNIEVTVRMKYDAKS